MSKLSNGFFNIAELLVCSMVIVLMALVILFYANPFEINKKARDAIRLSDMANLQQAINFIILEKSPRDRFLLCYNLPSPCNESSYPKNSFSNNTDGIGWIKINFQDGPKFSLSSLPIDPINNQTYHYTYFAKEFNFELNTSLESNKYAHLMKEDGGTNTLKYEAGNKLDLIN